MNPLKSKLREASIQRIFDSYLQSHFSDSLKELFRSLLQYPECISKTLQIIQQPHDIRFLTEIFDILIPVLCENSEHMTEQTVQSIISAVSAQLPATNTKVDSISFQFLRSASQFSHDFPFQPNSNPNINAFYVLLAKNSNRVEEIQTLICQKLTLNLISLSVLDLMSKIPELEGAPSIKSVISFFKSVSDNSLIKILTPTVIEIILLRLSPSSLKELPPLLSYLIKRSKKDSRFIEVFCKLVDKILDMNDFNTTIRPISDDLMELFLHNIALETNAEEITEPRELINEIVGDTFFNLISKMNVNPFDSFFISKCENFSSETILLTLVMIDKQPQENNKESQYEPIIRTISQTCSTLNQTFQLLVHLCGFVICHFDSKLALSVLVKGLEMGSNCASHFLLNIDLSFDFVFPSLSRSLKPGKSNDLFVNTLKCLMEEHLPNHPPIPSTEEEQTNSSSAFSVSNSSSVFEIPDFLSIDDNSIDPNLEQEAPTDESILFCTVLSSLDQFPELYPLLPLTASLISPQFSQELMHKFPKPEAKRYQTDSLAAFGNALTVLSPSNVYSLTQTFMMLLPGQAMLLLAITLQRLPREIIQKTLPKTIPFILSNPDEAGRMIALISYSHPDVAMSFIDTIVTTISVKRRVFFLFKLTETNGQTLIVIFKSIAYCSIFMNINFFVNEFLSFATKFLNKYLTHQSKSIELYKAALCAVRKLSIRVGQWQDENADHIFPFKDFLVQYVCAYYIDVGELVITNQDASLISIIPNILSTLSSLLPLKPLRISDKHDRSVELTAVLLQVVDDSVFMPIYQSTKQFFTALINCNPLISVFIGIAQPMFPALLIHQEWKLISTLLHSICIKWETFNLQQSSDILSQILQNIGILLAYALPLLEQEGSEKMAIDIVFSLTSLICAIRNQILSLPRSIRPSFSTEEELKGEALTQSVCSFLCKHLMTSNVFDLIMTLLDLFDDNKLLKIHEIAVTHIIKHLIKERGNEEFRFDSRIVNGILNAVKDKDDVVINQFMEIFRLLIGMRLFSILSIFTTEKITVSDSFFSSMIHSILETETGGKQLLIVLSDVFLNEERNENTIDFACRALPYLSESTKSIDNESWTKLFIGIARRTNNIDDELFKALVANQEYSTIDDFTSIVVNMRPDALDCIILGFPEKPSIFFIKLSLAFAASCEQKCSQFCDYAIKAMINNPIDESCFTSLQHIFESIDPSKWTNDFDSLINLLINNMPTEPKVLECTKEFLSKTKVSNNFWYSFNQRCTRDFARWSPYLKEISMSCPLDFVLFDELLPLIVVNIPNNEDAKDTLLSIGRSLDIEKNNDLYLYSLAIMEHEKLRENIPVFLSSYVSLMTSDPSLYPQCCKMIGLLCPSISNDNCFAIKAMIQQMSNLNDEESKQTVDLLMKLLK